jgi:hypothetical protein
MRPLIARRIAASLFPILVASQAATAQLSRAPLGDYAVYSAVARAHFLRPPQGEHGMACDDDGSPSYLLISRYTGRLWKRTARGDSSAAAELPERSRSLMRTLRSLDRLPRRSLTADRFHVGIPVRLRADSLLKQRVVPQGTLSRVSSREPPIIQFSPVAYSANKQRALVLAIKKCQVREDGEAEIGAYDVALLVPLEWRGATWVALSPVYMDAD